MWPFAWRAGHSGNDRGDLAAADGGIGGKGALFIVPGQYARPVQQENILVVRSGGIYVGKFAHHVDCGQLRFRQGGGKQMGHLRPGNIRSVAAGKIIAGQDAIGDRIIHIDLIPG